MTNERMKLIGSFVAGLLVMAVAFLSLGGGDTPASVAGGDEIVTSGGAFSDTTIASQQDASQQEAAPVEDAAPAFSQFSDLPPIDRAELPDEAIDTLSLIASGGPYPFSKDDSTFQNREGFLPDYPIGHYREYTVVTPGENDRGARRIVAGEDGELYYTSDHYASFSEILEES